MVQDRDAKNRRLAAIVFTDIVGFSALVNRDEALGRRALDLQRRVVRRHVSAFGGREIETAGDSFLLEFASAFAALRCVVAIQRALRHEPAMVGGDPPVLLRASIHLGDIEHRGREVFGDGVNVAARLLPLSPEGGLAVSDQVHSQIRHRLHVAARSLGACALKNIRHPVEVFVFAADALDAIPVGDIAAVSATRRLFAGPRRPRLALLTLLAVALTGITGFALHGAISAGPLEPANTARRIAVLPFANHSNGVGDDLLADGLQDSILTNLARVDTLRVTSRTSAAAYRDLASRKLKDIAAELGVDTIIEGSLQRQGDRIMVQVQLIDGATDQHLWAQQYERRIDDLFEVQSALARDVAGAVKVSLNAQQKRGIDTPPTTRVEAFAEYERALAAGDRRDSAAMQAAVTKALELDPGFALAHVLQAELQVARFYNNEDRSEATLTRAKQSLIRAAELRPELPELHRGWGDYYYRARRDLGAAVAEYEAALKLMPNDVATLTGLGAVYQEQDRLADALMCQRRAMELDPRSMPAYLAVIATQEMLRDYESASKVVDALERLAPKSQVVPIYRARLALARGDAATARAQMKRIDFAPALEKLAYYLGDLDEANRQILRQPEMQQTGNGAAAYPALASMAANLWLQGKHEASAEASRKVVAALEAELAKPDPAPSDQRLALAMSYAVLGKREQAGQLIDQTLRENCCASPVTRDEILCSAAGIRLVLGERAEALKLLDRALTESGWVSWHYIEADPAYRSLHGDAEFAAVLERARRRAEGALTASRQ